MKKMYVTAEGMWGVITPNGFVVIDCEHWTRSDFELIDWASDSSKMELAMQIEDAHTRTGPTYVDRRQSNGQ
jgi:hypothetical protein